MNYGVVLDSNYTQFSDDEKLNYGLKIVLSRLQTELNRLGIKNQKILHLRVLKVFTKINYHHIPI